MHERRERKKRTCIEEEKEINKIGLIIPNRGSIAVATSRISNCKCPHLRVGSLIKSTQPAQYKEPGGVVYYKNSKEKEEERSSVEQQATKKIEEDGRC
jgi:hypothetical protein